ncbi:MAG: MATE family efflux transporter [Eggerthellaceae bacterium]|nr:MATE family efflux transporter [Eggerthellaceae bacterium]
MGTDSIPRLITEFAIPSVVGMVVNGAYNIVDSIFLGQAIGYIGQATMTAANPIMIVFMAISMLIGAGGNALAALRLGQGDRIGAERSLGNTVTLSIIISVLVAILAFSPAINGLLTLSSATPEVWDGARVFIQILSAGFILQCIGLGVNNFIRTAGAPIRALLTMVIGTVVCVLFNFLLVMVLGMGVVGSALATLAGQAASCISVLWYFIFTKNVPLKLHLRYMPLEGRTVRMLLSLGLASFAMQVGAAILNLVLNHQLVVYGDMHAIGAEAALASIGVGQRIGMFTVFPLIGVAIAIQPLLGYNYGAHLFDRVRKTLWYGIAGATIIAVFMWAVVHLFPTQIVNLFGLTDPELHDFTIFVLKVQLMLLPVVGFQIVGSNYFQATGQPAKSIFLSLTRQILFLVPLMFVLPVAMPALFPQYTGLDGLVFAMPVADFLATFTTAIFVIIEQRRINALEAGELQLGEF